MSIKKVFFADSVLNILWAVTEVKALKLGFKLRPFYKKDKDGLPEGPHYVDY